MFTKRKNYKMAKLRRISPDLDKLIKQEIKALGKSGIELSFPQASKLVAHRLEGIPSEIKIKKRKCWVL